jgi:large subunit ribosomal protein L25
MSTSTVTLEADVRTERKKNAAGRLRRNGKIPAVVYGKSESKTISLDAHDFLQTFKHASESSIITIKANDGSSYDVLLKDYQQNILTGEVLHVDFYEFEAGKVLQTNVAVHLEGEPIGAREGGILEQQLHEVEVECLPRDIPSEITVDVSELGIGDSIHISEITPPSGVTFTHIGDQDQTIATVMAQREEEEPEEEAEEEGEELGEEGEAGSEEGEESSEEE